MTPDFDGNKLCPLSAKININSSGSFGTTCSAMREEGSWLKLNESIGRTFHFTLVLRLND